MQRNTYEMAPGRDEVRLRGYFVAGLTGDERAYRTFLGELSLRLRAFFRKRLFDRPDDVEDLVQETLLAVHNQRHTYDADRPLTAWIYAIARYKLVDMLRSRAGREALTESIDDEAEVLASTDTNAAEAQIDVEGLLARLPDRHRLPIVYVKLKGMSVRETARMTGMSESAIKVGIHRGLKALAGKIRGDT